MFASGWSAQSLLSVSEKFVIDNTFNKRYYKWNIYVVWKCSEFTSANWKKNIISLQNEASASVELPNICPGKHVCKWVVCSEPLLSVSEKFVTPNAIDKCI